jgi:hypothetical protein
MRHHWFACAHCTQGLSDPGAGRVLGGLLPEVLAAARPELVIYDAGTSSEGVQCQW